MLKDANHKGFTIIEVVITIAIGAAVMALVLNAVNGARRSQRNQARTNDVGLVIGAINQYYGNRNTLPSRIADVNEALEGQLSYYPDAATGAESLASTFGSGTFGTSLPSAPGDFLTFSTAAGTNNVFLEYCAISASNDAPHGDSVRHANSADCASATITTNPPGNWRSGTTLPTAFDPDKITIIKRANCTDNFDGIIPGGIREIVAVFQLEGQDGITCRVS